MATLIELVKELREKTGVGIADCKKALEQCECDINKAVDWLRERGIAKTQARASKVAAEGLTKVIVEGDKAVILEVNCETDFTARTDKFNNLVLTIAEALLHSDVTTCEDALNLDTPEGKVSEVITAVSFATTEKITLRRFEVVTKSSDETFGKYIHHDGKKAGLVVLGGGNEEIGKYMAMQVVSMTPSYICKDEMPEEVIEHERQIQTEIVKSDEKNASKPADIIAKMVEGKVFKTLRDTCLLDQEYGFEADLTVDQFLKKNNTTVKSFVNYVVGEGIEKPVNNWVEEVKAAQNA